jgi:hypothetical protein
LAACHHPGLAVHHQSRDRELPVSLAAHHQLLAAHHQLLSAYHQVSVTASRPAQPVSWQQQYATEDIEAVFGAGR